MATSEAQKRATLKWEQANNEKITVKLRKGTDPSKAELQEAAQRDGFSSLNAWMISAIREKLGREEKAFSELMQALAAHEGQRAIEENERLKRDPAADVPQSVHDKTKKLLSEM